eukprot:Hpha_TRINITY_DN16869_c1_g2::TRINITY_DN16869_c1_g2_i1::g.153865::m.153865
MSQRLAVAGASGRTSLTNSPRRLSDAEVRNVALQLKEERRERQAHERQAEAERLATARQVEEVQAAVADFQLVLASHEREVKALWARAPQPAPPAGPDLTILARLEERLDALEARNSLPVAITSPGARAGSALGGPTLELLFAQNRELTSELEEKVRASQEVAARDSARIEAQLMALREAVKQTDRQRDTHTKDSHSRAKQEVAAVRKEMQSFFEVFEAGIRSPAEAMDSGADGTVVARVCRIHDAIRAMVTTSVSSSRPAGRQDFAVRESSDSVKRLAEQLSRQGRQLEDLHASVSSLSVPKSGPSAADLTGQVAVLRSGMEQLKASQGDEAALRAQMEARTSALREEAEVAARKMTELEATIQHQTRLIAEATAATAAAREEANRAVVDARSMAVVAQEQTTPHARRQRDDLRSELLRGTEEARQASTVAGERAGEALRQLERLRLTVDEQSVALRRTSGQVTERDSQRTEEGRRLQQQHQENMTRMQQTMEEALRRAQRDFAQEIQRLDDGSTNLYRVVEELRAVQQRTLDEYHRQGDEQSLQSARIQQQTTDAILAIKESAEGEGERVKVLVQSEISTVNDTLTRARQDLQERMSSAERRLHDAEAGLDSFRARLRGAEAAAQESGHFQRSLDDARQRLQITEARSQALERWRGEVSAQLTSIEGRVADANKLGQITQLVLRLEDVEKCAMNSRAERDGLTRQLRGELEEKLQSVEARAERQLNQLRLSQQEQQNVMREMQRDVTKDEVQGKQLFESLRALQSEVQSLRAHGIGNQERFDPAPLQQRIGAAELANQDVKDSLEAAMVAIRAELMKSQSELTKQADEVAAAREALKEADKRAADAKRQTLQSGESMLGSLWDLEKKMKEMETTNAENVKDTEESMRKHKSQLNGLDVSLQEMKGYVEGLAAQKDGPVKELQSKIRVMRDEMHTELAKVRRILERAGFQRGDSNLSREVSVAQGSQGA